MLCIYYTCFVLGLDLSFTCSGDVGKPTVNSEEEEDEALETVRFNFNVESLGLVLYSDDSTKVSHMKNNDRHKWSTVG